MLLIALLPILFMPLASGILRGFSHISHENLQAIRATKLKKIHLPKTREKISKPRTNAWSFSRNPLKLSKSRKQAILEESLANDDCNLASYAFKLSTASPADSRPQVPNQDP